MNLTKNKNEEVGKKKSVWEVRMYPRMGKIACMENKNVPQSGQNSMYGK